MGMKYRAKHAGTQQYAVYTYGAVAGKPLENDTMKGLARSIAYLYHRSAMWLYESNDGKHFRKADDSMQTKFARIMSDEFTLDEWR